ncbi:hypothetical protein CDAR_582741 [Caerostris darwini]|uniref:C2H2-type domain-containing protein n=1 Tax=Caerostris darwini TaxID=1538125 RepID=A0AAV4PNR9_9ARAC|nr:hypothetical protein CDAR_582741 [Caerostris darwini]
MGGSSFLVSDESSRYLSQGSTFIKCSSCDKCFTSILTLNKHEVWHHKSLFRPFKHNCESCPYATNNRTNFKKHLEVHSLDRRCIFWIFMRFMFKVVLFPSYIIKTQNVAS